MNVAASFNRPRLFVGLAWLALSAAACASSKLDMSTAAPTPDKRVGLRAGWMNVADAAKVRMLAGVVPDLANVGR